MTPRERHQHAMELFDAACDLAPDARDAFLRDRSADDHELYNLVVSLLEADHASDPAVDAGESDQGFVPQAAGLFERAASSLPERIGRYRIVGRVGEGGMGIIYEAEQSAPKRRVALKVIRPGLVNDEALRRFDLETHVLGQLQHVGIAQIFEAGIEEVGSEACPFFAMEFIDGPPIDRFADLHELDLRDRLELIARVCDAAHHAHQRGVIHRDLKPANVLVVAPHPDDTGTRAGDRLGQPKVLDFGIARATSKELQTVTVQTETGQLIGTLAYMSPEQVSGTPDAIDIRSDVYAIGVMLYELLTGHRPLDLSGMSIIDAAQTVRETEPARPGTLNTQIRGDLETIIAHAIAKEADQRYPSAHELGEDLRRFLRDEPILAQPHSRWYYLRKFTRRNRGLVGGAIATSIALVAGVIVASVLLLNAIRANQQLTRSIDDLERVSTFQQSQFDKFDPRAMGESLRTLLMDEAPSADRTELQAILGRINLTNAARGVLDETLVVPSLDAVDSTFADRPRIRASLYGAAGTTRMRVGLYRQAREPLEQALAILTEEHGDQHPKTLEAITNLLRLDLDAGYADDAAQRADRLAEIINAEGWNDDLLRFQTMISIAHARANAGSADEAITMLAEAAAGIESIEGPDHRDVLVAHGLRADMLSTAGRFTDAEALYRDVYHRRRATRGREDHHTITALAGHARCLQALARYDEAITAFEEVIAVERQTLGELHPETLTDRGHLATVQVRAGRLDEAEASFRLVLEEHREASGSSHPQTISVMRKLADLLTLRGKTDESVALLEEAVGLASGTYGPDDRRTCMYRNYLANALSSRGDTDRAFALYQRSLASQQATIGPTNRETVFTMVRLGALYMKSDRLADAKPLLLGALEIQQTHLPQDRTIARQVNREAARLYLRLDQPDEAAAIAEALVELHRPSGRLSIALMSNLELLATVRIAQDRPDDAIAILTDLLERRIESGGEEDRSTTRVRRLLESVDETPPA